MLTRKLRSYLHWRNANASHPDILAAQRRERSLDLFGKDGGHANISPTGRVTH